MSKQDTIAKYTDAYLKGRSQSFIDKFNAKTVEQKYSAIMTWRHRAGSKSKNQESLSDITDYLSAARQKIQSYKSLTQTDIDIIKAEVKGLDNFLDEMRQTIRDNEIADLLRQQEEITRRLQELGH